MIPLSASHGNRMAPPVVAPTKPQRPPTTAHRRPVTPFPHPYKTYPIQQQFMETVYDAVDKGKVAIVESPTGTGKTLSLICSALHWLAEQREGLHDDDADEPSSGAENDSGKPEELDWLLEHDEKLKAQGKEDAKGQLESARKALAERIKTAVMIGQGAGEGTFSDDAVRRSRADARRRRLAKLAAAAAAGGSNGGVAAVGSKRGRSATPAAPSGLKDKRERSASSAGSSLRSRSDSRATGDAGAKNDDDESDDEDDEDDLLLVDVVDSAISSSSVSGNGGSGSRNSSASISRGASVVGDGNSPTGQTKRRIDRAEVDRAASELQQALADPAVRTGPSLASETAADGEALLLEDYPAARPKLYFASRTHSQLAQFVGELNKTSLASKLRVMVLGSRKALCTNPDVTSLGSDAAINERCTELAEESRGAAAASAAGSAAPAGNAPPSEKTAKAGNTDKRKRGCPFLSEPSPADGSAETASGAPTVTMPRQEQFKYRLLAAPSDIEDAAALGDELSTCAYYGSRKAVAYADVIALPYSMLLMRQARESMGLDLRGSIVCLDEAHNLLDTINAAHSCVLTHHHVNALLSPLRAYYSRYATRLGRASTVWLLQLMEILEKLGKAMVVPPGGPGPAPNAAANNGPPPPALAGSDATSTNSRVHRLIDFCRLIRADHIDLHPLLAYIEASQLARKLRGFVEKGLAGGTVSNDNSGAGGSGVSNGGHGAAVSGMYATLSFLKAMASADNDCRITINQAPGPALPHPAAPGNGTGVAGVGAGSGGGSGYRYYLKFINLNPSVHFRPLLEQCRSIILAGGTMQPMSEIVTQLFSGLAVTNAPASSSSTTSFSSALVATQQPTVSVPRSVGGGIRELVTFSCGHVIPDSNLLGLSVDCGPSGLPLDFRFANRNSPALLDELGRILIHLVSTVPCGVVVFLPSYDYEKRVWDRWSAAPAGGSSGGAGVASSPGGNNAASSSAATAAATTQGYTESPFPHGSVLWQLARRKRLFREPRAGGDLEAVLRNYAAHATSTSSLSSTTAATVPTTIVGAAVSRPSSIYASPSASASLASSSAASSACSSACASATAPVLGRASAASSAQATPFLVQQQQQQFGAGAPAPFQRKLLLAPPQGALFPGPFQQVPMLSAPASSAAPSRMHTPSLPTGEQLSSSRDGSGLVTSVAGGAAGALLFAVVGGKMSEGINFCDDLARCVVVVGLPFPNASDPELKERMAYLDARPSPTTTTTTATGTTTVSNTGSAGGSLGQEYYENLCMRAVNQSIGRAIRHANDYAAIALLDARYSTGRIRNKLPKWISTRVVQCASWGPVLPQVQGFFRHHREKKLQLAAASSSSSAATSSSASALPSWSANAALAPGTANGR